MSAARLSRPTAMYLLEFLQLPLLDVVEAEASLARHLLPPFGHRLLLALPQLLAEAVCVDQRLLLLEGLLCLLLSDGCLLTQVVLLLFVSQPLRLLLLQLLLQQLLLPTHLHLAEDLLLPSLILGVQCHAVRDAQILERKQIHLELLILGVQCHAVRDAQILERKQIHLELVEEDRRQDAMMEVQRLKEIDEQEQMDRQRKERSVRALAFSSRCWAVSRAAASSSLRAWFFFRDALACRI
ncbi:hypothetical protein CRUP_025477 [Coryphaenoides rupestris]|nr:hypothetical protein CRUP_025477 [Coryphaenoides rupestris]